MFFTVLDVFLCYDINILLRGVRFVAWVAGIWHEMQGDNMDCVIGNCKMQKDSESKAVDNLKLLVLENLELQNANMSFD